MGASLGIFIESVAGLFEEISCSAGKNEAEQGRASIFMMGFLQHMAAALILLISLAIGLESFRFSFESLPTFLARAFFDILQVHVTLLAIKGSERTAFSFVKILTIPLLLVADLLIGYVIDPVQIIGMIILTGTFFFVFSKHVLSNKAMPLIVFSAVNPVLTITLFKYNITNFNSVGAEQFLIYLILTIYLLIIVKFRTKEKVSKYIFKPISIVEAFSAGLGGVISGYAYLFAAPSIIITARRASSILWSTLSGLLYFKEDHKRQKLYIGFLLIMVLLLLTR